MNSTATDIATLLDGDTSLGLTLGTDLFVGRMPDQPANCVVVYDNPGDAPMLTYKKATSNYFYSSVSVRIRNTNYESGWAQMFAILEFLHASSQDTIGMTYYALIKAMNDPQVLHWDDNDRVLMVVNFEVQRRDSTASAFTSGFSSGFD